MSRKGCFNGCTGHSNLLLPSSPHNILLGRCRNSRVSMSRPSLRTHFLLLAGPKCEFCEFAKAMFQVVSWPCISFYAPWPTQSETSAKSRNRCFKGCCPCELIFCLFARPKCVVENAMFQRVCLPCEIIFSSLIYPKCVFDEFEKATFEGENGQANLFSSQNATGAKSRTRCFKGLSIFKSSADTANTFHAFWPSKKATSVRTIKTTIQGVD
jgi:hypothetical protein